MRNVHVRERDTDQKRLFTLASQKCQRGVMYCPHLMIKVGLMRRQKLNNIIIITGCARARVNTKKRVDAFFFAYEFNALVYGFVRVEVIDTVEPRLSAPELKA